MYIDENATIIDVRTPDEFAAQHVPGSVNVLLDQMCNRVDEIKICRSQVDNGGAWTNLKKLQ